MDIVSGPQGQVNGSSDPIEQLRKLLQIPIVSVTFFDNSRPRRYVGTIHFRVYFLHVELPGGSREFLLGELADFSVQRKFRALVADKIGLWPARLTPAQWDIALAALTAAAVKR